MGATILPPVASTVTVLLYMFMGSEGFGRVEIKVRGKEGPQSDVSPDIHSPSIEFSPLFFSDKDGSNGASPSKSPQMSNEFSEGGAHRSAASHDEQRALKKLDLPCLSPKPTIERDTGSSQSNAERTYRCRNGASGKRHTILLLQGLPEKTRTTKQRRLPKKLKNTPLSSKPSPTCFGSASGTGNFFGSYGLKGEWHDVMKDEDEVPLSELLDGSYVSKRGKETPLGKSSNDDVVNAVRNIFSLLQLEKTPEDAQISKETDLPIATPNSRAANATASFEEKGTEEELGLLRPGEVLERLSLGAPTTCASLLLKNTCAAGKTGFGMPAFAWSQPFSGSNGRVSVASSSATAAAAGLASSSPCSASKGFCHGRWMRLNHGVSAPARDPRSHTDITKGLTFDMSAVPCKPDAVVNPDMTAAQTLCSLHSKAKKTGETSQRSSLKRHKRNGSSPTPEEQRHCLREVSVRVRRR